MRNEDEVRWSRERSIELALEYYKVLGQGASILQLLGTTKAFQHYINSGQIESYIREEVRANK